jgi:hypothetical protein
VAVIKLNPLRSPKEEGEGIRKMMRDNEILIKLLVMEDRGNAQPRF